LPGSYIDVLAVDEEGKNRRVILEGVLVFGVDMMLSGNTALQLAVRPGDKEKLETAVSQGKLYPVLRPLGEAVPVGPPR
jgi:hypothetical protein